MRNKDDRDHLVGQLTNKPLDLWIHTKKGLFPLPDKLKILQTYYFAESQDIFEIGQMHARYFWCCCNSTAADETATTA